MLRANFAALCVAMTLDIKQFNCKSAEREKHQWNPQKPWQNQFCCAFEYVIMQQGQRLPKEWKTGRERDVILWSVFS